MGDPYLFGFYVGLATATTIEIGALVAAGFFLRARRMRPRPARSCETCEASVGEDGISRDSLFRLYVCPTCLDTVPRRFARGEFLPVCEIVEPVALPASPPEEEE